MKIKTKFFIIFSIILIGCAPNSNTSQKNNDTFNNQNQNNSTNNQNNQNNQNNNSNIIDNDHDGYSPPMDCDDSNPNIHPNIPEICDNGIDDNCNGYIDGNEPDDDGDGYGECTGDCDDSNPQINPDAVENLGDNVDNDCDGEVDEPEYDCDCARDNNGHLVQASPFEALGICDTNVLVQTPEILYAQSYGILKYDDTGATPDANGWGNIKPIPPLHSEGLPAGCQALVLFTGQPFNPEPQTSTTEMDLQNTCPTDPASEIDNAEPDDTPTADCYDLTQYKLKLKVPSNANSFSFDFLYLSAEYPEWVGSEYNDTFYAILTDLDDPSAGTINVSFDSRGKAITVNNDFFETPPNLSVDISGTGYENVGGGSWVGSTTGWLKTTVPVNPGHTIELTFSIHDEGDHVLDSAIIIDNFTWDASPVEGDAPITVE